MKKYILLVSILFASCDMPMEEVKGFGFWLGDENETFVAGPSETTDLYNKFIDAHNQKDMETIESMLSEDIVIYHSDGRTVEDKSAHLDAIQVWFDQSDPSFNSFWGMPYKGVNNGETWMIAGHQTLTTVDGVETSVGTMLDIQFTDGLVSIIIVYDRQTQPAL
tara:strand:+ start:675 stop:1166 length:492 start_codon:yes stop_codon:yes gene_type:complete